MLKFDPFAELEKIRAEKTPLATSATSATDDRENAVSVAMSQMSQGEPCGESSEFPRLAYASTDTEDDALALAAIEGGDKSYGAVATTTGMGASRAWRAVERLQAAGLIDLSYRLIGDEG